MKRNAAAVWEGGLKTGKGTISTESRALSNAPYSFGTRFEQAKGTNPEELIAAAHAGCYSMALSLMLGESDIEPERIDTTAHVTIEADDSGFSITAVHLEVFAKIAGMDNDSFQKAANAAKEGCPVSKVLNAKITLDAKLRNE
ncbi:MAG TPA: OsmC family protein [Woeseiaceae bacterium]|nr:OsmC family protein [Woeseiaceae bacterium]